MDWEVEDGEEGQRNVETGELEKEKKKGRRDRGTWELDNGEEGQRYVGTG